LRARVKSFALKKDAEAFQQRTLEEEAVSRTKFDELFERVANLELLIPRVLLSLMHQQQQQVISYNLRMMSENSSTH
jgi:hypothetical protein